MLNISTIESADDETDHGQADNQAARMSSRKRVVIVGGGFGGVAAARALRGADAEILLIDRRNHHIFQPLLYQVATAVLSPAEVAAPLRGLARRQANLSVLLGEVTDVDLKARTVMVSVPDLPSKPVPYDYLVVATGVAPTYFGHDQFAAHSSALKSVADAEAIRDQILRAYERAEQMEDSNARRRALTFVLVGAGPTGVELAASMAQMARLTLARDFRRIDPTQTTIVLLDGAPRVLPTFAEPISRKVAQHLVQLGVEVRTGVSVEQVDELGVIAGGKRIETDTVLWTAGVHASPLLARLAAPTDRTGRVMVDSTLALPADTSIFVVGDAAALAEGGHPLPGVAQVAIQEGRFVGRLIARRLRGEEPETRFRYRDLGNMAVVGKNYAVLQRGSLQLSGLGTWLIWAIVHVLFLPQLQNRLRVQTQWLWSYITDQRSSRLIRESRQAAGGR